MAWFIGYIIGVFNLEAGNSAKPKLRPGQANQTECVLLVACLASCTHYYTVHINYDAIFGRPKDKCAQLRVYIG